MGMEILMMPTKGCGQLTSNTTYFSDSCFSGIKTAEEAMALVVNYCGPAKTSHKSLCLATLEKLTKDWPGRSYLVMKSTPRVSGGKPLIEIGYTYNCRKVLGLIANEGAGSTEPGDPYLSRFLGIYSDLDVGPVLSPHLLYRCLNACNAIENQNRMHQYDLALEKYWVTQSGYFILATTVEMGMGITKGKPLFCIHTSPRSEDV